MNTFFWHDYETWGIDPSVDRPCQFAGMRTDENLNPLGEPLNIYCKPAPDILPHPEACLITGIAPQKAFNEGLVEAEFMALIHQAMSQPYTCNLGYNSLRFDDEVTRYSLYRNFYDPYEREWANGNSRWDIIDMVRLCFALRPDGLEWPQLDGRVTFKLEALTQANHIMHGAAHDALSDVEATIALARLIKNKQPALFDYVYQHRQKNNIQPMINMQQRLPLLHISSKYSAANGCAALVMPLAWHPTNKNALMVYNLSTPPGDLIQLTCEQIHQRLFTAQHQLSEHETPIPLKLVHLNKCPILLKPNMLDEKAEKRLNISKSQCEKHWQQLLAHDLTSKIQDVFTLNPFTPRTDPERQLYDAFISDADKKIMADVRAATAKELSERTFIFKDKRLTEMLWRYKARNYPTSLSAVERAQWLEFCRTRLSDGDQGILSVKQLQETIQRMDEQVAYTKDQKIILQQLYRYSLALQQEYQLSAKCCW